MHIKKKEAVNGTEEVNQVLVATIFGEMNQGAPDGTERP